MGHLISIVVPCYNEAENIPLFLEQLGKIEKGMPAVSFECIFVDDGSNDGTLNVLRGVHGKNPENRYISFSRNFGKEAALLAGLKAARGDYVAVMDADLQHPPELLPKMYAAVTEEGFDCAAAKRVTRKGEPFIRSFFAKNFYKVVNKISSTQMVDGATDYRLMTRQVKDAVLSLEEYNRFSKGLFSWVGFATQWVEYENIPRAVGTSKWSIWKLAAYSLDGITAFSVTPLAVSSLFGILFCLASFLSILVIVVRWLLFGDPVAGWASTVTIVLFVGGIQLFCTGILGQYLAKAYMEGKRRPAFIIKESAGHRDEGGANP
jgi:glycosyltransferase involved in cell wall biosynthesis